MKILIIIPIFPPEEIGGAEIATYNIFKLLKKRNDIQILTSTKLDNNFFHDERDIYRIAYPQIPIFGKLILWIKMLIKIWIIKPEVLHIQFLSMGFIGVLYKLLFKKPFVIYARGSDVYYDWPLKKFLIKIVLSNAEAVIALTSDMSLKIKSFYPRKVHIVPNGVNIKVFRPDIYKKNKNEKVICYVGNLRPVKGVKYLLEAFRLILEDKKNVKLIIIGDGPEKKRLEKLSKEINISSKIKFLGDIPNSKLQNYLNISDIFVLPSISEGFPNVVLEAMACGLPVVATNIPGIAEVVENGVNGLLFEKKNSKMLAIQIIALLNDNKLMESMSEINLKKASEYSWDNVVKRLEEIYLEIVN